MLVAASLGWAVIRVSNQFDISRYAITTHINTLEEAGLVQIKVNGREHLLLAYTKTLKEINGFHFMSGFEMIR